jgi:hypothetical protein
VGGIRNQVRGRTKIETWLKFQKVKREILGRYEMVCRWPANKKEAYGQMEEDPETGEWVLEYNFHT